MGIEIVPSLLGEAKNGGTEVKVAIEHTGSGQDVDTAKGILTGIKINLEPMGYEAVHGAAAGSFLRDGDDLKTIESSNRARVHAMRLTHADRNLSGEKFEADLAQALQSEPVRAAHGRGRGT